MRYKLFAERFVFCVIYLLIAENAHAQITIGKTAPAEPFTVALNAPSNSSYGPTITGGNSVSGTISVNTIQSPFAIPTADRRITALMTSSHPQVAIVPGKIAVEAGRATPFTITTKGVTSDTRVTISVTLGNQTRTVAFLLVPAALTKLTVDSTATSGQELNATIMLTGATAVAQTAHLTANPATLVVPNTVEVPAGASQASFKVQVGTIASQTTETIAARMAAGIGALEVYAQIVVRPLTVAQLTVGPNPVVGGGKVQIDIQLNGPAPAGGAAIALSSNNPALIVVPGFALVPAGSRGVTIDAQTNGVVSNGTVVRVTATHGGASKHQDLTLNAPVLAKPGITIAGCVMPVCSTDVLGGMPVTATVQLAAPGVGAAQGFPVYITSDNSLFVAAPGEVRIPAGMTSAPLNMTTYPTTEMRAIKIGAFIGTPPVPLSATFIVRVLPAVIDSFVVTPTSVSAQAGSVDATIKLSGPAPNGATIPLSWSALEPVAPPASVPIPNGVTTVTFKIPLKPVTAPTQVSVSANYGGVTRTATFAVTP